MMMMMKVMMMEMMMMVIMMEMMMMEMPPGEVGPGRSRPLRKTHSWAPLTSYPASAQGEHYRRLRRQHHFCLFIIQ